jgi:hypothetical protein
MDKYYTSSLYIYAWRLQDALPPLDLAVADVVSALSVWQPNYPIYRFDDPPRKLKLIDRASVKQYLDLLKKIDNARGETFDMVSLIFMSGKDSKIRLNMTYHASENKFQVTYDVNLKEMYQPTQNELRISYDCLNEQPLQAIESSEVLWKVCRAFGAFTGGFGGDPPCERRNILSEEEEYFPGLLRSVSAISRFVPAGIWWINYWDSTQVETLGRKKVMTAPWAKVQEVEDGALLLTISEEWPHVLDKEYPQRRLEIARHLQLREHYDRYSSGSNSYTP